MNENEEQGVGNWRDQEGVWEGGWGLGGGFNLRVQPHPSLIFSYLTPRHEKSQ